MGQTCQNQKQATLRSRINSFLHSRTCFIKRTFFPFPNSSHFSVHLAQNTRITSIACSINSVCRSTQLLTYPTVSDVGSRIISMPNYQFHSVGISNLRHTLQDCSNYLDVRKTQQICLYKKERKKFYSVFFVALLLVITELMYIYINYMHNFIISIPCITVQFFYCCNQQMLQLSFN